MLKFIPKEKKFFNTRIMKHKFLLLVIFVSMTIMLTAQKYVDPQWQIPLYFEDATGAKDTVWLGYDPNAGEYGEVIDPQFGESWEWIDTSQFNVYFFQKGGHADSVRKRDINSYNGIINSQLYFTHGQLPVTVKWEEDSLNSPYLPEFYPDISPRPKARIDMVFYQLPYVDCDLCIDCYPDMILTGYTNVNFPYCTCVISDSLVFKALENPVSECDELAEMVGYIEPIAIAPHDYDYTEIPDNRETDLFIYPNPVIDKLTIENVNNKNVEILIYNLLGKLVFRQNFADNKILIDFADFCNGIYLVKIINGNKIKTYKIYKMNMF